MGEVKGWYEVIPHHTGTHFDLIPDGWYVRHPDGGGTGHPDLVGVDHYDRTVVEKVCRRLNRRLWWQRLWVRLFGGCVRFPCGNERGWRPGE